MVRRWLGVDLGQHADYTALALVELTAGQPWNHTATYQTRYLQRLPLGTSYPAQVDQIVRFARSAPPRQLAVVVDATGVGGPVVDMLAPKLTTLNVPLHTVTIHGGDQVMSDRNAHRVPKRDLVSALQVVLQSARIVIARNLDHAETLMSELQAFKATIRVNNGHDSYGNDWRDADHDDLVLALAIAVWVAETRSHRPSTVQRAKGAIPQSRPRPYEPLGNIDRLGRSW